MNTSYFITGACGGLGRAVTMTLADKGARVFASDIDREALERLSERPGVDPLFVDVTDAGSARAARIKIEEAGCTLGGIICAAGVHVGGPLVEVCDDDIRRALDINVMGAVTIVRELLPLLEQGSRIVLVSSESTRVAVPFTGPYAMSKCALEAYGETLRRELLPLGIRVTVIQPGAIRTRLLTSAAQSLVPDSHLPVYRKGIANAASVLEKTGRNGMAPAHVANVIVRILQSHRPLRSKRVGNEPALAFLSLLPAPLVDSILKRFL